MQLYIFMKEQKDRAISRLTVLYSPYRKYIFYPTLELLGIEGHTPHSFCTLLDRFGVDKKLIQQLAGHSDYAFTENNYVHPDVEQLRKAIQKISPKQQGLVK